MVYFLESVLGEEALFPRKILGSMTRSLLIELAMRTDGDKVGCMFVYVSVVCSPIATKRY